MTNSKKLTAPRLICFQWRGINRSGKKVSGKMLAINELEVRGKLQQQQIRIRKLKGRNVSMLVRVRNKAKPKDITMFTRQLATMLTSGVPLIQAIKMIADSQPKVEMTAVLLQICNLVEAGTPVSKAMHTYPTLFNNFYCDLVATGEQTGKLADIFNRLASYKEKSEQLKAKVIKAMIYPSLIIVVAGSISILMLTIVIPEFEAMFMSMGAKLPWFTQQVIGISHFLKNHLFFITLIIFVFIFLIRWVSKKSYTTRLRITRLLLKFPILGGILRKAAIARFSRTLATSCSAGIPVLSSLLIAAKTSGNLHYQLAIEQIHQETASGSPIYIAMRNTSIFPDMVLQMVMIGEESGNLDDMLNRIANIYESEIDDTVDNLGKIIEPIIIIILGVIVGGLVVSLYLPIFNMAGVF